MPSEKPTEKKKFLMDLYAFIEWTNQLTYLVFFTAILMAVLLLMNYFLIVQLVPSMQSFYSLPALITALIAFGVVLIFSVQRKRVAFEIQLKKDMK